MNSQTFLAKTIAGLEEPLEKELVTLGANDVKKITRGVTFSGSTETLYRANYSVRTALRILCPVHSFEIKSQDDLYNEIMQMDWPSLLGESRTIAIDAVVSNSVYTNSLYLSQRAKDAVVDKVRTKTGKRPSVDLENPDMRVNVHLNRNLCSVSLDSSGVPLFKRGYRERTLEAPMNEVLAAGLVALSGWDKRSPLIDPMCGSGTLLIEAALAATNTPAGFFRKEYGLMKWPGYDADLWQRIVSEENGRMIPLEATIFGFDKNRLAVAISRRNIRSAGFDGRINVEHASFHALPPPVASGTIITNPPYDERMKMEDSIAFYKMMGDILKRHFSGYKAWIVSADMDAIKAIGLKPLKKFTVFNGPLECRFLGYELFSGSHKDFKAGQNS